MTFPVTPLSLPLMTTTRSPFLTRMLWAMVLQHLRGERDDLHVLLLPELTADWAEDAGPPGVTVPLEDHRGVLVELDVGPVGTTTLLDGPHDDGLDDLTLLDVAARDGVLDGRHDDVADAG